ncbi:MAG TPA: pteridine-dependent deoxygenase [Arenimonas sp.]|uniref:chorismate transformation enzyme, FkbO/Hyg5 family n=1 Tax=Arenimonas sp. TaxID=1872635 RepID=UPI002D7EF9D5|nr:pteridine-dependent deoxygenase [Arenimonas sp.]HEU0153918.1 pteridine-dependent deoxygenase [Arenimonas sp.]
MNSPTPAPARLRIVTEPHDEALIPFRFQSGEPSPLAIGCAPLAGPADEAWLAGAITESAETAGAALAHGEHYALVALAVDEAGGDIEAAAAQAYARLLVAVRPSAHPYLLRIWNYFAAINQGSGDDERYRRFCVGRARAVDGMFNDPPPAATAIGTAGEPGTLKVVALCSRAPAIALENPRQTPAWQYPREHGPVSPGFSRGAVLDADTATPRLLASGTASIVGHVSLHLGDCAEQLRESLRNLEALMAQATGKTGRCFDVTGCEALRIYLRHEADLAAAQSVMATSGIPADRISYLRGDVCRRELDVELEGVFAAG